MIILVFSLLRIYALLLRDRCLRREVELFCETVIVAEGGKILFTFAKQYAYMTHFSFEELTTMMIKFTQCTDHISNIMR